MGLGIYFGPDNPYNRRYSVRHGRITNQRAELLAATEALRTFDAIWRYNGDLPTEPRRIVIKTDSAYMVGCMTDWICNWKRNGYVNYNGIGVASNFRQTSSALIAS